MDKLTKNHNKERDTYILTRRKKIDYSKPENWGLNYYITVGNLKKEGVMWKYVTQHDDIEDLKGTKNLMKWQIKMSN